MKKRVIALLLVLALAFSCLFVLASCNDAKKDDLKVDEGYGAGGNGSSQGDITIDTGNPSEDDDNFTKID